MNIRERRGISNVISTILLVVAAIIAGSAVLAYTNGFLGGFSPSAGVTLTGQLTVTGTSAVMTLNIQDSGATAIKTGAIILPASMSAASTGGVTNGCTGSGTSVTLSSAMNPGSSTTCYLTGSSSEFKAGSNYPVTITASESGGTVSQTITLTASP